MGDESTVGEVSVGSLANWARLLPSKVESKFWLLSSKSLRVVVADADLLLSAVEAAVLLFPSFGLLSLLDFVRSFWLSLSTSA